MSQLSQLLKTKLPTDSSYKKLVAKDSSGQQLVVEFGQATVVDKQQTQQEYQLMKDVYFANEALPAELLERIS